jgi:7-carboxy-7-deazaguanine synthase
MLLKVSELFYSVQGEGRWTGVPSVFLRTFGCNFRCEKFGRRKDDKTPYEYKLINPIEYRRYDDLPLVSTGCDSYASWDPRFKHLSPVMSVDDVVTKIVDLLPFKEWNDEHLVITGGEPLLGWQRSFPELLAHDKMQNLAALTFETNGTQPLSAELQTALKAWGVEKVTFSVSPKLSCSGEPKQEAIRPEIVNQYQDCGYVVLKFVVGAEEDAEEALETIKEYRASGFVGPVYLMPVGGVESVYNKNNRWVAEFALKHGLRYSDRLQVPLFANKWGT